MTRAVYNNLENGRRAIVKDDHVVFEWIEGRQPKGEERWRKSITDLEVGRRIAKAWHDGVWKARIRMGLV